jgi:hypothetical protein
MTPQQFKDTITTIDTFLKGRDFRIVVHTVAGVFGPHYFTYADDANESVLELSDQADEPPLSLVYVPVSAIVALRFVADED